MMIERFGNQTIVKNKSIFAKEMSAMTMNIPFEKFIECMEKRDNGALIQDAFPMLNRHEREFIITGATAEEWDKMFAE